MMGTIDKLERVVAPVVAAAGLELVDVEVQAKTVRVTVDREGGVDLDAIGGATAAISRALDDVDPVPGGSYELEVSSPGLERRLRRPEHFGRHLGALVSVRTRPGTEGERRLEGTLVSSDDTGVRIEVAGREGEVRQISYDEIERAHTVFDWKTALAGTSAPSARREHKAERRRRRADGGHERDDERHGTETR